MPLQLLEKNIVLSISNNSSRAFRAGGKKYIYIYMYEFSSENIDNIFSYSVALIVWLFSSNSKMWFLNVIPLKCDSVF